MMDRTIRVRRSYISHMGISAVMFTAFAVFILLAFVEDVPKLANSVVHLIFACFMFAFYFFMTVVFFVAFILSVKSKLTLQMGRFAWRYWWKDKQYALGDITAAWWRQGRVALLTTTGRKIKIEVHEYHTDDQEAVIRFFRLNLPLEIQNGWEKFWQKNWMVFDRIDTSDPQFIAERAAARRRIDICFIAAGLMAFTAGCLICPLVGNYRIAFSPMAILLFWPIRFMPLISTLGRGPVSKHVIEQMKPEPKRLGWFSVLLIFGAIVMCIVAIMLEATGVFRCESQCIEWAIMAMAALIIIALPFCIAHDARPADCWRREYNARAAKEADKIYLRT